MTTRLTYKPASDAEHRKTLIDVLAQCFVMPAEDANRWVAQLGEENFRVLLSGSEVVGGLGVLYMGQFFGGRSVSMAGISAVGIAPTWRGRKVARELMSAALREARDRGIAISTLYPATATLYRSVGYELAGQRIELRLRTTDIPVRERDLAVRAATPEDEPLMRSCYARWAPTATGTLDRHDFIWRRVWEFRGDKATGFLFHDNGSLEGYVFYIQKRPPGLPHTFEMTLTDVVATTPRAARRILTFLADHSSLVGSIWWCGAPAETLLTLLPELRFQQSLLFPWMVRLVDVQKAFSQRGYANGLKGELHLDVQDDLLDHNAGLWVLRVEDGKGEMERGGRGTFEVHIRGLASLFSGFLSPRDAWMMGLLEAGEAEMEMARAIFSGPTPWMRDMF